MTTFRYTIRIIYTGFYFYCRELWLLICAYSILAIYDYKLLDAVYNLKVTTILDNIVTDGDACTTLGGEPERRAWTCKTLERLHAHDLLPSEAMKVEHL